MKDIKIKLRKQEKRAGSRNKSNRAMCTIQAGKYAVFQTSARTTIKQEKRHRNNEEVLSGGRRRSKQQQAN